MTPLALATVNENPSPPAMAVEIVPIHVRHIRELQQTIRADDRRELEGFGFPHAKSLWRSYKHGLFNKTALIDGKVAACWGVGGTILGETGQPWLLTSYEAERVSPLRFAKIYQQEVFKMLEMFPRLSNFVLADYGKAVRLLQIIGFQLGEPVKIGNEYYLEFSMARTS